MQNGVSYFTKLIPISGIRTSQKLIRIWEPPKYILVHETLFCSKLNAAQFVVIIIVFKDCLLRYGVHIFLVKEGCP